MFVVQNGNIKDITCLSDINTQNIVVNTALMFVLQYWNWYSKIKLILVTKTIMMGYCLVHYLSFKMLQIIMITLYLCLR